MKFAVPLRLFLLLYVAMPIVARDARAARLSFQLYALGFPVAESSMSFDLTPSTYRMELHYRTTGLVTLIDRDKLDQSVSGTLSHDTPLPLEFSSVTRLKGRERLVSLQYRNGDPAAAAIDPPNETERDIVPVARRDNTVDPLSAMVDMLYAAARTGRCDVSRTTYDGRRLESFQVRTMGEETIPPSTRSIFSGRGLRCDYTSQPIAGLRVGDGHDDDARVRKGTIWLAQVVAGEPRLPVRGLIDVRFLGAAMMYLTAVAP